MGNLTSNEMKIILKLFKDFNSRYNANSLSKEIGITPMGTLKILKKLYNQKILKQEYIGNQTQEEVWSTTSRRRSHVQH